MFLPKKSKVFDDLVKQAEVIHQAAKSFDALVNNFGELKKATGELESLEQRGDELVHTITDEIERSFVLSMDKEDIRELTETLDDIIDNLEHTANRLKIYNLKETTKTLKDFAEVIVQTTEEIHTGVAMIRNRKFLSDDFAVVYRRVHDLENKGDVLHRGVLERLMNGQKPTAERVFSVLRWKEVYQTLEDVLDRCERVAIVFQRLRIKYR